MRRRSLLSLTGGAALAASLPAIAQSQRVMRVGVLGVLPADHPFQIESDRQFAEGMRRLGWEVGRNLLIDYRNGRADRELHLVNARAFVESKVDLIIAVNDQPTEAAFRATKTTPIVMIGIGAVEFGYATSLARPGGNVTGVAIVSLETVAKPMEVMRAMRPGFNRLGFSTNFESLTVGTSWSYMEAVGRRMGVALVRLPDVSDMAGIEPMLAAARREAVQAVVLANRLFLRGEGTRRIQAWATENKVMTWGGNWQRGELLISFGPSIPHLVSALYRQVDRALRGGNPAEMPIEEPAVYDFIINLQIARAMGLTVPQSVLLQATEVIE